MIRSVHLHGSLARRFGPRFDLMVETPAEAIRALAHMLRGFREAIAGASWRVVRGRLGLEPEALGMKMGSCRELHVLPAPIGRKNGAGVGKIIAGVVLIAAAVVTAGAALGAFGAGAAGFVGGGVTATGTAASGVLGASAVGIAGIGTVTQLAFLGIGMVLTGASMLLSPQPKANGPLTVDQNPSFMFNGPVNTNAQGGPVPLVYGKIRVGSVVTGSALYSEDYVANPATPPTGTPAGKLTAQVVGRT